MKYAVVDKDGLKYKDLANRMTRDGHSMTAAYANVVLINSFEKLIIKIAKKTGKPINSKKAKELARTPEFQENLSLVIRKAFEK